MKSTILLAIALFLVSAPSPDSNIISEISAGFLLPIASPGSIARESVLNAKNETEAPANNARQLA